MMIRVESRLVRKAQRGDGRATEEVARMCRQLFCRRLSALHICGDAQEDVAQQALAGVLRGLSKFQWRASFETWALTILERVRWQYEEEQRRRRERELREADADPGQRTKLAAAADPDGDPVDEVMRNVLREALADCLGRVPPERREVWVRHRLLRHEHQAIAIALGINANTVATRIHRADRSLRKCLEGKGITAGFSGAGQ